MSTVSPPCKYRTYLKITRLRDDPFVDELLRILGETKEELSVRLQLVDGLDSLVDFVVQPLYLLLTGRRQ